MLIVAVHDVAPSTLPEVRWLLARLDSAGVRRRVLKVVPGEPGAPDESRRELDALVGSEAAAGSEIVLHGWTHRAEGPYRGGLLERARARAFAGRAAEFLALDPAEMRERLALGRAWLAARGLTPGGFCPPSWLWAPELPAIARREGFRYLVSLRGLADLRSGHRLGLAPIGYIGAGVGQEQLWRLGEAAIWRPLAALRRGGPRRFFLHPQGASTSADCARVLRAIALAARTQQPGTYAELLGA